MEPDTVIVNGLPRPLVAEPHTTALDWLRDQGLTGAKEGCAEGECGACAVLVARPGVDTPTEWTALNACLMPAAALDGQEVVTAEGLGVPRRAAPGPARDGGPRRLAVRLLHAGLRLQHGRRVLPRRPGAANGRTASTCTRSAATCAGAPATGRSGTPRSRSATPTTTTRSRPAATSAPPVAAPTTRDGFVRPADLAEALRLLADAARRAGRRRLHRHRRRGQPARRPAGPGRRRRPARRSCASSEVTADDVLDRCRAQPHRDRAPARRRRCRCSTRRSRSSPRGRSATPRPSAATSAPPPRSATSPPRCSPSTRPWC